jgi:hypothetical protein
VLLLLQWACLLQLLSAQLPVQQHWQRQQQER